MDRIELEAEKEQLNIPIQGKGYQILQYKTK